VRDGWAVVCDFDGTALTEDLGDAVSQHFAGHCVARGLPHRTFRDFHEVMAAFPR